MKSIVEPLIEKVKRLLGPFCKKYDFTLEPYGDQTNSFGCAVFLESEHFAITVTYDRSQEFMSIGIRGKRMSNHPIGHLVAYLEGKKDPYPVTTLEQESIWLIKYADKLLDSSLLLSKDFGKWVANASRRMWHYD